MTANRDDDALVDMLLQARKAMRFIDGITWTEFQDDEVRQLALTHVIQTIGEAAQQVSREKRSDLPQIPWEKMVGMRHRLVHDYRQTNIAVVWQVVHEDLPSLVSLLESHIPPDPDA